MMQISELAARAGITPRTIRYYEELGMIRPEGRTEGGFRLYSDGQLRVLRLIQNLKTLGLELESIRDLFQLKYQAATGGDLARSMLALLEQQQEQIARQVDHYLEIKTRNARAIKLLGKCLDCDTRIAEGSQHECELYESLPEMPTRLDCADEHH